MPEIWKNKSQIAEGIKNLTFKQKDIEELALARKEICKKCIWFNQNQRNKSIEEIPEVIRKLKSLEWIEELIATDSHKCMSCGCGLGVNSIKLRCLSCRCPIGSWSAVTTEEEQIEINKIIDGN